MMTREAYAEDFIQEDETLKRVRMDIEKQGMPAISVAPELGKLLTLLVRVSGATSILEIGALGGYSGICLARGLPPEGRMVSLELKPEFAQVAAANVARAGFAGQVEYRTGQALDSLASLQSEGQRFDFVFLDADKPNYPAYLDYALSLTHPGALIVADNVFAKDRVLNPSIQDPAPAAMRAFNQRIKEDERLESVLLPVRDGFIIARVKP